MIGQPKPTVQPKDDPDKSSKFTVKNIGEKVICITIPGGSITHNLSKNDTKSFNIAGTYSACVKDGGSFCTIILSGTGFSVQGGSSEVGSLQFTVNFTGCPD